MLMEVTEAEGGLGKELIAQQAVRPVRWWAGTAFWAVMDQGLFAVANFAVGILLARWLSAEQFGSYAVAFSVFLLAGTLHSGLFIEPMLVFGSARYADTFRGYLTLLLRGHWLFTPISSVVLAIVAGGCWFFASSALSGAFLGVALAAPFILFGWLVRRACFSCLQPQWAAAGGAIYLVLLLTTTYGLRDLGVLSAFTALVVMGGAGLASGVWILRALRSTTPPGADADAGPAAGAILRDHWAYGRWALASSALSWVPGNIYSILLPMFAGLEASAALKALSNLILPIGHLNNALATQLIPALAAARERATFNRLVRTALAAFGVASLVYGSLLTFFREPVIRWLYAGGYRETVSLVPVVALLPLGGACVAVLGSALRVLERPHQVFWAYVISIAFTASAGIPLTAIWGLTGAVGALLLSSLVTATASGVFLFCARGRNGQ